VVRLRAASEARINKNVLVSTYYLGDEFFGSNNQRLAGYKGCREENKAETREEHFFSYNCAYRILIFNFRVPVYVFFNFMMK
jgi:hypothetical protein